MAHIDEHTKITLTIGQLRRLVKEDIFHDSWKEYDADGNYSKEMVANVSDAIRTMFYWIEQNTNLEIRFTKDARSPMTKSYQLWGKPDSFRDAAEFQKEVDLIREQIELLDLGNYLFVSGTPTLQMKDMYHFTKEYTCHIWFDKRFAFDFNDFKKDTRPKDNYNWQNRSKIKKLNRPR